MSEQTHTEQGKRAEMVGDGWHDDSIALDAAITLIAGQGSDENPD